MTRDKAWLRTLLQRLLMEGRISPNDARAIVHLADPAPKIPASKP